MNVVTFNDRIREILVHPRNYKETNELFPNWEHSPLFDYDEPETESETAKIVHSIPIEDCFEHIPFNVFRLNVTVGEAKHPEYGHYRAQAIVTKLPDGLCICARVNELLHTALTYAHRTSADPVVGDLLPLFMLVRGIHQSAPGSTDFLCDADVLFGVGGRFMLPKDKFAAYFSSYVNGFLKSLAAFNLSAMAKNNHIVRVTPNRPEKSVEWLKARTHYTLISHGHPANSNSVHHGARVTVNQPEELKRMAHNRRAHQRTMRHARFRFSRGKTIWVKATWVGPKEWKDEGGRQIYRILEPVDPVAAAA